MVAVVESIEIDAGIGKVDTVEGGQLKRVTASNSQE
jgi:hypothetical protein